MLNRIVRHIPGPDALRGGWLHRVLGEGLFHAALWRPTRFQVAGGFALGTFIALTPTMGVQMLLAGVAAFVLRLNVPAGLAACWITNPLSAPFIYTLQYQLGVYLSGQGCDPATIHCSTLMENAVQLAWPLWIGSLASAALFAPLTYLAILFGWRPIARRIEAHRAALRTVADPSSAGKTRRHSS